MNSIFFFAKKMYSYTGKILFFTHIGVVLSSLLDGLGVLLLVPMISATKILDLNYGSTILQKIFHPLTLIPQSIILPAILFIYVMLVIGQSQMQRILNVHNSKITQGFSRRLRNEIYLSMLQADWDFFLKRRKSDFINLITTEVSRVIVGTSTFMQLLSTLLFTFIQICIALWLSGKITIFVLLSGIFIMIFAKKFLKEAKILGRQTSEYARSYLAGITDHFNGIKDIKGNTLEESRLEWFNSITEKMANELVEYAELKYNSQVFYKSASAILVSLSIFFSINLFPSQPTQLILILLIFSRLWPKFIEIQSNMEQIASSIPAFKNVLRFQNDCDQAREILNFFKSKDIVPLQLKQKIECRNVNFSYSQGEIDYSLKGINLEIYANQMTAIVGKSGAGKSTLIDLLIGLLKPVSGQILLDGKPLSNDKIVQLRQTTSYVPQDPFLFNATIKENLLIINPKATENEIWEALELAAAKDFVLRLPSGLNTLIGDRGIKLSGGERQRLVLARAVLRKPSLLILDEATSALDTENESKIQDAIEQLKGKMTIIVIAHRLSTIRNADQVVVLDKGEIIQQGQFSQLAKEKRGMFSRLLKKQMDVSV
ncbi:ABC transporter ATP-binding protein [Neobacillus rhizosphaerae]|uniref:ABC transporter ATP-binding protein n=1 Tax=Neobacillus rhizosphaerae TaxID=2880965 RepID=UPI003D275F65